MEFFEKNGKNGKNGKKKKAGKNAQRKNKKCTCAKKNAIHLEKKRN
jgi:hypothetical protein